MKRGNRVAVIGAGVIGMTCATLLQEQRPDVNITILADKFLTETTSDGAAGIFRPGVCFSGPSKELTKKWLLDSYDFYMNILNNFPKVAEEAGIKKMRSYHVSSIYPEAVENHFLREIIQDYRKCNESELKMYGENNKYGNTFTTFLVESRKYLPYSMKKFQSKGGKVIKRKIDSFEELVDDFDVIINCCGLGSKYLCDDLSVTAIRGQIFKVHAPWIEHAVYEDYDTYIIPGTELVTMGGTRNFNSFDDRIRKHDSESIWERCTNLIPSLKNAKVVREWVGFRPYRPYVRVERETKTFPNGRTVEIVHNYGHGGYGVMTAPGTSLYAVQLANECLQEARLKISKL